MNYYFDSINSKNTSKTIVNYKLLFLFNLVTIDCQQFENYNIKKVILDYQILTHLKY